MSGMGLPRRSPYSPDDVKVLAHPPPSPSAMGEGDLTGRHVADFAPPQNPKSLVVMVVLVVVGLAGVVLVVLVVGFVDVDSDAPVVAAANKRAHSCASGPGCGVGVAAGPDHSNRRHLRDEDLVALAVGCHRMRAG